MDKGLESLIEAVAEGQRKHSDFADRWCEHFTEDCLNKMRNYAESENLCEHKCEYCDKFKWAVDRAKHYSEKTGTPYTDFLKVWETDRTYWFLNFYQECNQPKIEDGKFFVFETIQDYKNSLGGQGFVCPNCGVVTKLPFECPDCNYKSHGLIRLNLVTAFVKENMIFSQMFMPVAWKEKLVIEKGR